MAVGLAILGTAMVGWFIIGYAILGQKLVELKLPDISYKSYDDNDIPQLSCVVMNEDRSRILGTLNMQDNTILGPVCLVSFRSEQKRKKRSGLGTSTTAQICKSARLNTICGDNNLQIMEEDRNRSLSNVGPNVGDFVALYPNDQDRQNPIMIAIRRQFRYNVYRTEHLHAIIRSEHLVRGRAPFRGPSTSLTYFRTLLNALPTDDRGHLLADSLGGVPYDYNLVPQARYINRPGGGNDNSEWSATEQRMRRFFSPGNPGANGGHVDYNVRVLYDDDDSGRPFQFFVIVEYYYVPSSEFDTLYQSVEFWVENMDMRKKWPSQHEQ